MSGSADRVRWRAAAQHAFAWANEDNEPVLYHRPSGQTHFINAATALLLRQILLQPNDAESASQALAAAHEAPESDDLIEHVAGILLRLEELGLVERVRT